MFFKTIGMTCIQCFEQILAKKPEIEKNKLFGAILNLFCMFCNFGKWWKSLISGFSLTIGITVYRQSGWELYLHSGGYAANQTVVRRIEK